MISERYEVGPLAEYTEFFPSFDWVDDAYLYGLEKSAEDYETPYGLWCVSGQDVQLINIFFEGELFKRA